MPTRRRALLALAAGCLPAAPGFNGSALARSSPPGEAVRVACTDWTGAETLLALGIVPAGVIDRAGYDRTMVEPSLPASVVELGAGWAPNVELLQYLQPDFILIPQWSVRSPQLARIAPVVVLQNRSETLDAIDTAKRQLPELAERFGAPRAAQEIITRFDEELQAIRASLSTWDDRPIAYLNLNPDGRNVSIATATSLFEDVARRLGLKNAWGRQANVWSFYVTGVEQLASIPDARLIYADQGARTEAALRRLADNRIWNSLPAVREGRISRIPATYAYGSLPTALRLARMLAQDASRPAGSPAHG
ncbi:ABC transporter substrate-binding protein [Bosea sp. NBC_00550]|uniref:ABC transporter substrate-binding protein n=1 Tax=Bosea sp. NBC_00550 TaxID=2969621 RepID=UPI002231876D|nr:ABC transporter substrate-binding protein [Bosea sp. NBC_00550]UZF90640.1 ABC transporter substrate-binding protein [Bosea sp. NBC_00550]